MEITNKEKYLIIRKAVNDGEFIANEFLNSFLDNVGKRIAKGDSVTDKQLEILDKYIERLVTKHNQEDLMLLEELNKEADSIDIVDIFKIYRYELTLAKEEKRIRREEQEI